MKASLILLAAFLTFSSFTTSTSVNISKQKKMAEKVLEFVISNNSNSLSTIFVDQTALNAQQLNLFVKQASKKIRGKGSKNLFTAKVMSNSKRSSLTFYEFSYYYTFNSKQVHYYKVCVLFDNNVSKYKPLDIKFVDIKDQNPAGFEMAGVKAMSPFTFEMN